MTIWIRWRRFVFVGVIGTVVQLAALAMLNARMPGHYLWTSTAAIELALLHNFVWHLNYTWRDRRDSLTRRQQLARFHVSNGLVSMAGNAVLMRLLVGEVGMRVVAANLVTVLSCSIMNFVAGNGWAFARSDCEVSQGDSR